MSRTSINVLARYRCEQKKKRERRLAEAHAKVDPVQKQLELDDEPLSRESWASKFIRQSIEGGFASIKDFT